MANFTEPTNPTFVGVRQIETNDPVLGGAAEIGGNVNSPPNHALRSLVERTAKLKADIEAISIPNASTGTRGIARLATTAQVTAGTNDDAIVTPLLLQEKVDDIPATPNASTGTRGIAELATESEAEAATDTSRITPPRRVRDLIRHSNAQATETIRGTVLRASQSEVSARTEATKYVTPDTLPAPSSVPDATETTEGIAELANQSEGRGGSDDTRIMTSERVLDALRNGSSFAANTTRKGTVQRATQAEVTARTEGTKYVTPDTLPSPSSVPDAAQATAGIAELANSGEGRGGIDNERIMTSLRVLDALRNGSSFYASTTQRGTAELATQAEVDARSDNSKIVTPATLPEPSAVANASESTRGIIEIANATEAAALTDDNRAMTPEKVLTGLRASAAQAGTTQRGTAELATQAEVNARSDNSKIVTPATLPEPSAVANASEAARGIIEIANATEAVALTDDVRAMTAEKVLTGLRASAAQATGSNRGTAAIASTGEADGGTNNTDIMTSFRVKRRIDAIPAPPNASETTRGLIEVVNAAEAAALTDDTRAMTPEKTLTGLRGSAAQATGSNRGTAAIASTSEADGGTNNTDIMTASRVKRRIDAKIVEITQDDYDALSTPNSNILYAIVG